MPKIIATTTLIVLCAGVAAHAAEDDCEASGGLEFVCGPRNAEDLVPVPGGPWIIASGMADGAALFLIGSRDKTWSERHRVAGQQRHRGFRRRPRVLRRVFRAAYRNGLLAQQPRETIAHHTPRGVHTVVRGSIATAMNPRGHVDSCVYRDLILADRFLTRQRSYT
jgi:hypothetical protein